MVQVPAASGDPRRVSRPEPAGSGELLARYFFPGRLRHLMKDTRPGDSQPQAAARPTWGTGAGGYGRKVLL